MCNAFRLSKCASALVMLAAVFAAHTASAELLLYDGFATVKDSQNRAPYKSTNASHALQGDNAASTAWTTGVEAGKPWNATSAVVFSFPNKGLSLPADFASGTGDQFTARGGSAGFMYSGTLNSERRGKNRALTSAMPTSGMLLLPLPDAGRLRDARGA